MTELAELASELKRRYAGASGGRQLTALYLFAIEHAQAIRQVSKPDLLARAELAASYVPELNKAINLADYVTVIEHTR